MTTDDQIRDEELQYDINGEAAKISVLSLGKDDKYEYLTREEILPSNQKQIIGNLNLLTPFWQKTFENQTRTIEGQGKKQINTIQDQEQIKTIKKYTYNDEDSPMISKQNEIES